MKNFTIGLIVGIALTASSSVFAGASLEKVEAYIRPTLPITLDGNKLQLQNAPVMYQGNTYLPLRETATILGKDVNWNDATQTVELKSKTTKMNGGNNSISLDYKNPTIYSDFGDSKQYVKLHEVAVNVYELGYTFVSDPKLPSKGLFLEFNNEPYRNMTKTKILIENIQISPFNAESYLEYQYYKDSILPLIK